METMNDIRHWGLKDYLTILLISLISLFLVFWKSPHSNLGDNGIYIDAGRRLVSGDVVYQDGFRGGPLGALSLYLVNQIFPAHFSWAIFQFVSIASLLVLSAILTRNVSLFVRLLAGFFAISSAPARELLHNHQITALVIVLVVWPFYFRHKSIFVKSIAVMSCAIAMDLKPQITLFLLFGLALCFRRFDLIWLPALFFISSHFLISIFRQENISGQWISLLLDLNEANKWGESIFLWPLLENLGVPTLTLYILQYGSIITLIALMVKYGIAKNINSCLITIGLLTYFLNYSHFYDCLLIATLAIVTCFRNPNKRALFFMMFAIIPGEFFNPLNFIFWLVMTSIFLIGVHKHRMFNATNLLLQIILLFGLHMSIFLFIDTFEDQLRLRSTIYVFLAFLTLLDTKALKKVFLRLSIFRHIQRHLT